MIFTGHFDGELAHVSAVDTRPLVWSAPRGTGEAVRAPTRHWQSLTD